MITFKVPGKPTGKARARFNRQTGRTYTPADTQSAEERVRGAWSRAGEPRVDGPLFMALEVVVERPDSHFKLSGALSAAGLRAPWPTRRPDLSNIAKLVEDALNTCAYRDDAKIVRLVVTRRWANAGEAQHIVVMLEPAPVPALQQAA